MVVYDVVFEMMGKKELDFVNDDIRILLVDSTTTADTNKGAATISAFTVLGEISGTGYSRKSLVNKTYTLNSPSNRAEFDADNVIWNAIDAGTIAGIVVYKHVNDDTDSIPLFYLDDNGSPFNQTTNGEPLTFAPAAAGIAFVRQAA